MSDELVKHLLYLCNSKGWPITDGSDWCGEFTDEGELHLVWGRFSTLERNG